MERCRLKKSRYSVAYAELTKQEANFDEAAKFWSEALAANPNQYIWRRRIQQYGPRQDKPYPFYDWIETAQREIRERGEQPIELSADLTASHGKLIGQLFLHRFCLKIAELPGLRFPGLFDFKCCQEVSIGAGFSSLVDLSLLFSGRDVPALDNRNQSIGGNRDSIALWRHDLKCFQSKPDPTRRFAIACEIAIKRFIITLHADPRRDLFDRHQLTGIGSPTNSVETSNSAASAVFVGFLALCRPNRNDFGLRSQFANRLNKSRCRVALPWIRLLRAAISRLPFRDGRFWFG